MRLAEKRLLTIISLVMTLSFIGCNGNMPLVLDRDATIRGILLDAEDLSQFPHYPTGCESVAAVMALRYCGIDMTIDAFIDNHLPCSSDFYEQDGIRYGPDPYTVFVGDPRAESSYGCMSPVIKQGLESCLNGEKQIIDCGGMSLDELCHRYIDNEHPVILWATMDMGEATAGNSWFLPDGRFFVWTAGEHCLLLVGYDDHNYYFNDPRYGETIIYNQEDTERAYAALGKQALVIQ